jgi:hypothetical protein
MMMNNKDSCKKAINRFLLKQVDRWTGLPDACKRADLEANFVFQEGTGTLYAGMETIKYSYTALKHEGFESSVFFNFSDDRLCFITTEYWSFSVAVCNDIIDKVEQPEHHLDFYWRNQCIKDGEWVYPHKGITLCIIPETGLIAKVIVYPICDIDLYKRKYYHEDQGEEFPHKI